MGDSGSQLQRNIGSIKLDALGSKGNQIYQKFTEVKTSGFLLPKLPPPLRAQALLSPCLPSPVLILTLKPTTSHQVDYTEILNFNTFF